MSFYPQALLLERLKNLYDIPTVLGWIDNPYDTNPSFTARR